MDIYLDEIPEYVEPENISLKRDGSTLIIITENGTKNIRTVIVDGKTYKRAKE
jgi:hypothetical protein